MYLFICNNVFSLVFTSEMYFEAAIFQGWDIKESGGNVAWKPQVVIVTGSSFHLPWINSNNLKILYIIVTGISSVWKHNIWLSQGSNSSGTQNFSKLQGRKKPRSDCLGQVNFTLGEVKIEVQWPSGQVKLVSESVFLWEWRKCQKAAGLVNHWVESMSYM